MIHRFIDQIHRADNIIRIIKSLDKMRQTFGSIRGKMKDVVKFILLKEGGNTLMVGAACFDEGRFWIDVLGEPTGEIVYCNDSMSLCKERVNKVRSDKPGSAGN